MTRRRWHRVPVTGRPGKADGPSDSSRSPRAQGPGPPPAARRLSPCRKAQAWTLGAMRLRARTRSLPATPTRIFSQRPSLRRSLWEAVRRLLRCYTEGAVLGHIMLPRRLLVLLLALASPTARLRGGSAMGCAAMQDTLSAFSCARVRDASRPAKTPRAKRSWLQQITRLPAKSRHPAHLRPHGFGAQPSAQDTAKNIARPSHHSSAPPPSTNSKTRCSTPAP